VTRRLSKLGAGDTASLALLQQFITFCFAGAIAREQANASI
jgi:hypothetical protein